MDLIPVLQQLLFGVFLGSVIGLEREKKSQRKGGKGFAGIRTFALLGMSGVLLAIIETVSIEFFWIIGGGLMALLLASYVSSVIKFDDIGGTTELSLFAVLMSGYFLGIEESILATSVIIITLLLLQSKKALHYLAGKITKTEFNSIVQFIIIALIILPLLPDKNFGPYEAFNPYVTWMMVVLISAISFAGYLGIKLFGAEKGISLTGFLGGMISSTAVSLSFSQNSKKYKRIVSPFVFGIVIASTAMFFRIFAEIMVLNPDLANNLWIPMFSAGCTGLILSGLIWYFDLKNTKTSKLVEKGTEISLGKPLDLLGAIKFGLLFALILLVSKAMGAEFGDKGIYLTSVISGLVDTDAISVSLANLAKEGLDHKTAVIGITIATLTNTFVKAGIVLTLASRKVAWRVFGVMLSMIVAGGVGLWIAIM